MVRTSERSDFLKCRQMWKWRWVDLLSPKAEQPALEFGDYIHQALAAYYIPGRKRGPHPAQMFETVVDKRIAESGAFNLWSDEQWTSALELGIAMLNGYVKQWEDADQEYEIISSEQTFQLPIGKVLGARVVYVGTIDGVWRHLPTSKIRFAEHKTGVNIVTEGLAMNEQTGAYWTYGPRWLRLRKLITAKDEFDGILYNFLRKSKPSDRDTDAEGRALNKDGTLSKRQPPKLFHREMAYRGEAEAEAVRRRVRIQARDMLLARREPGEHIYKNPGPQFLPNCKFCSFSDMCEVHETGNNWEAMIPGLYDVWDPYADHERIERM